MQELSCPDCGTSLAETRLAVGASWSSARCKGLCLSLAVLRALIPRRVVRQFWSQVLERSPATSGRACPSCRRPLRVIVSGGEPSIELDACFTCQLLWFDLDELAGVGAKEPPLTPAARAALAHAQVEVASEARAIEELARAVVYLVASRIWPHPLMAAHLLRTE